jgi:hypothetical protein
MPGTAKKIVSATIPLTQDLLDALRAKKQEEDRIKELLTTKRWDTLSIQNHGLPVQAVDHN